MTLDPGTKLGPYEIVAPIGAGGMGEVYRARDTRLNRDVAIKVLPTHLSRHPDARARFDREAKAISSFNHPHICALYDMGHEDGVDYLVMELLEGESLAARIAKGPLPLSDLLRIGAQIADALDKAHQKGLVHRDLKPGNVILTPSGAKLLDFGLARPAAVGPAGELTSSPTLGTPLTAEGTIVGTFQYMSPEQLEGSEADPRSDIWALGVTLYEMATGKRAFEGKTQASLISSILRDEPRPIAEMMPLSPPALDLIVSRCLAKHAVDRWQSAGDLAFALQSMVTRSGAGAAAGVETAKDLAAAPRRGMGVAAAVALMIAAGAVSGVAVWIAIRGRSPQTSGSPRFTQLTDRAGEESAPTISPDGLTVGYAGNDGGRWKIYVQRVGGRNATLVASSPDVGLSSPSFSPDGGSIAYHESDRDGGIFVAGATGESARRVTDFGFHPAWSPDGKRIVFGTEEIVLPMARFGVSQIYVAEIGGGPPKRIYEEDAAQPAWSPSGARIAFWAAIGGQRDIYTIPAEGGSAVAVTKDADLDWSPAWSADGRYLYFASDRGGTTNLWRVPMEEASGRTLGPPEAVTGGVRASAEMPSVSRTGRLVFRSQITTSNPVAIPFDPFQETIGDAKVLIRRSGSLVPAGISRDGLWLSMATFGEKQEDVFISRVDGSDLRRLTDDPYRDRWPVFSPDGKEIAFYSNRGGQYSIWAIHTDGGGLRRITDSDPTDLIWASFSSKGDRMLAVSSMSGLGTFVFDPKRSWKEQSPEPLKGVEIGDKILTATSWSPDDRRILGALSRKGGNDTSGIGVYDVATASSREVYSGPSTAFSRPWWLSDGRRAVYVEGGEAVLIDVDSGRRRILGPKLPFDLAPELIIVAPDDRTIYASNLLIDSDIWMLETGTPAPAK